MEHSVKPTHPGFILRIILAVIAGEAILVFLITIVQESIFGGITFTHSPWHHLLLGGTGTFLSAFIAGLAATLLVDKRSLGACRRSVGETRTSKYYSERGAMKEHSGATRLKSNEVQNNIFRSQSIKCFSDRLLAPHIIISLLIVAESTWLILYSSSPDPVWFEVMASSSLLAGIWLGGLVFRMPWLKKSKGPGAAA